MRVAIIDCGTNTFHLIIADLSKNKSPQKIYKKTIAVKLGEAGISKKIISRAAFRRGINALIKFKKKISKYKVEKIFAFATAAIRSATNGKEFIKAAKLKAAINIKLISGNKEAEQIYCGVRKAVKMTNEKSLIMDIGGGSVEFIICNWEKIFWKHSFNLGASLLLEEFKPSDPIKSKEIILMEKYFNNKLKLLFVQIKNNKSKIKNLIGSSGSFDTFAELIGWKFYDRNILKRKTEYYFDLSDYYKIHKLLINSTSAERLIMKGMIPLRVDMIIPASILLTFVLIKLNIEKMTWSDYALKEGILFSIANKTKTG